MSETIARNQKGNIENFSIFSYGFRPFFLVAGIYAIVPLIPWLLYLLGSFEPAIPLPAWHAHEMLFGFVGAGLSGFLLSAIPNWTNTPPLTGAGLKRFVCFWLVGRMAFWLFLFFHHPIFGYLLFLDLLLPISQTIRVARIFIITKNKRNFIFIGILLALACANFFVILDMIELSSSTKGMATFFAPNIIMITIAVIGGRVIPNFTRNYLKQQNNPQTIGKYPFIEKPALLLLVLNALIDLIAPHSTISYTIALLACAAHLWRFSHWGSLKTLKNPIVWVLHLGYFWLIIALFLKGTEGLFNLPYNLYLHAFTVGAVGLFMLGIMSRAALGHTGRALIVSPLITIAYFMVLAAAIIRTITPFYQDYSSLGMTLTVCLWSGAYILYLWTYIPILTQPRVDGKPG